MPLPFDLPRCSRGFAALALAPGARATGSSVAGRAAASLGEVLGLEVRLTGRPLPCDPARGLAVATLAVELAALPDTALLAVEAGLVARRVAGIAGGGHAAAGASALTPLESSALELLALAALDGASAEPAVADLLAPRLVRAAPPPRSPLAVELELAAGSVRGRARLFLPPAALAALAGPPALEGPVAAFPIAASLLGGAAPLLPEELEALVPGDVVLVDPPHAGRHELRFPGGLAVTGTLADDLFTVEETSMEQRPPQIPLTLEVELARVPITLADLARLAPGAALPLHLDRRGLVTLRLGERALARGELVDVDGAVGVRVLSMEAWP